MEMWLYGLDKDSFEKERQLAAKAMNAIQHLDVAWQYEDWDEIEAGSRLPDWIANQLEDLWGNKEHQDGYKKMSYEEKSINNVREIYIKASNKLRELEFEEMEQLIAEGKELDEIKEILNKKREGILKREMCKLIENDKIYKVTYTYEGLEYTGLVGFCYINTDQDEIILYGLEEDHTVLTNQQEIQFSILEKTM